MKITKSNNLIDRLEIPEEDKEDHIKNPVTGQVLGLFGSDATNGTEVVMQPVDTSKFVENSNALALEQSFKGFTQKVKD